MEQYEGNLKESMIGLYCDELEKRVKEGYIDLNGYTVVRK